MDSQIGTVPTRGGLLVPTKTNKTSEKEGGRLGKLCCLGMSKIDQERKESVCCLGMSKIGQDRKERERPS